MEMASYWLDAAMRKECLGDSRVEPEHPMSAFGGKADMTQTFKNVR